MNNEKTNRIMATATVAIALGVAMQGTYLFSTIKPTTWAGMAPQVIVGLLLIFITILATKAWYDLLHP